MPNGSGIERRNRALIAFLALTGIRVGAAISLKMKHVNLLDECIVQDAREVNTKFRKTSTVTFFPVNDDIKQVFVDYVAYLRKELMFGPDDPLFPKSQIIVGERMAFKAQRLSRYPWKAIQPVGDLVRENFIQLGLPKYGPHSFRKTLARMGTEICKSPEEMKAWSQNLSHEGVLTTFTSYGDVLPDRQSQLLRKMAKPDDEDGEVVE